MFPINIAIILLMIFYYVLEAGTEKKISDTFFLNIGNTFIKAKFKYISISSLTLLFCLFVIFIAF